MIIDLNLENLILLSILVISVQISLFLYLRKKNVFFDDDFKKPQSVHNVKIPRIGGMLIISGFLIFAFKDLLNLDTRIIQITIIILISFFLGFIDDCKIIHDPIRRFSLSIIFFLICTVGLDIKITSFGDEVINSFNDLYPIQILLSVACLFAVCNGANLIDGFNGLLLLHTIFGTIIFSIVSFLTNNFFILEYLIYFLIILMIPSILNFPKAKVFMGDSGAYLCGGFLGCIAIELNRNLGISPFFLATVLLYFITELLFSITRKISQKKSPFKPDGYHLHLLLYTYLKKKGFKNSNFLTSVLIFIFNLLFCVVSLLIYYDIYLTKIVCFSYLLFYTIFYSTVLKLSKN